MEKGAKFKQEDFKKIASKFEAILFDLSIIYNDNGSNQIQNWLNILQKVNRLNSNKELKDHLNNQK